MHIPEENHSPSRDENPIRRREIPLCSLSVKLKRLVADLARNFARIGIMTATLGFATFLLCQCHRQPSTATSTPTPSPTPTPIPVPTPTPTPVATPTPTATPPQTPSPTATPTNTPSQPQPAWS